MSDKKTKPIVLMLIEGWGLSPNWRGNAIASANASNFQRFWHSYYHIALRTSSTTKTVTAQDPLANYYCISTGKNIPDLHKLIINKIATENASINRIFQNSFHHNSAVHFIGSVSKNSESGDINILEALIRSAKDQKVFRLYLHILADDSYEDKKTFLDRIVEIEQLISRYDLGEIATISGISVVKNEESLQNYNRLICEGLGERYMDAPQAVNHSPDLLGGMKPVALTENKDARIKDFDTVVFFNHQLDSSRSIINQFFSGNAGGMKVKLNFTEVWTLINFPTIFGDKIHSLFRINEDRSLVAEAEKSGGNSFFISEAERSAPFNFYFDSGSFSKCSFIQSNSSNSYLSQWRKIIETTNNRIFDAIDSQKYKLIIGNYSVLPKLCRLGNFNDIVQGVSELDRSMSILAEKVLEQDGMLFIASPYGLIEKVDQNYQSQIIPLISSGNPVPLIVIANNSQISHHKENLPKESINELVSPKKDLTAIHRLLLLLLNNEGFD